MRYWAWPLLALLVVGVLAGAAAAAPAAQSRVYLPLLARQSPLLPPGQVVGGHTLEDAARATAAYNVSLRPNLYPKDLPYQSLNNEGGGAYVVPADRYFYVPVAYADDSPPILGAFPADRSATAAYFFGKDQLGAHDCFITVDGIREGIGAEYLVGPVTTDPLPDGGGTHYLTLAAFLRPLPRGMHTVVIGSAFDGAAVVQMFGAPLQGETTYTVVVE
jgi:hypothetical protein